MTIIVKSNNYNNGYPKTLNFHINLLFLMVFQVVIVYTFYGTVINQSSGKHQEIMKKFHKLKQNIHPSQINITNPNSNVQEQKQWQKQKQIIDQKLVQSQQGTMNSEHNSFNHNQNQNQQIQNQEQQNNKSSNYFNQIALFVFYLIILKITYDESQLIKCFCSESELKTDSMSKNSNIKEQYIDIENRKVQLSFSIECYHMERNYQNDEQGLQKVITWINKKLIQFTYQKEKQSYSMINNQEKTLFHQFQSYNNVQEQSSQNIIEQQQKLCRRNQNINQSISQNISKNFSQSNSSFKRPLIIVQFQPQYEFLFKQDQEKLQKQFQQFVQLNKKDQKQESKIQFIFKQINSYDASYNQGKNKEIRKDIKHTQKALKKYFINKEGKLGRNGKYNMQENTNGINQYYRKILRIVLILSCILMITWPIVVIMQIFFIERVKVVSLRRIKLTGLELQKQLQ